VQRADGQPKLSAPPYDNISALWPILGSLTLKGLDGKKEKKKGKSKKREKEATKIKKRIKESRPSNSRFRLRNSTRLWAKIWTKVKWHVFMIYGV